MKNYRTYIAKLYITIKVVRTILAIAKSLKDLFF